MAPLIPVFNPVFSASHFLPVIFCQSFSGHDFLIASLPFQSNAFREVLRMVTKIRDLQVRDDLIVTIAGTVVAVREDEFLLQDSTGQVWVDAVRRGSGTINLAIGEQVTVTGDLDDLEDFDAVRITRSDGSEVIGQPPGNGSGNGRPGNGRPGNGRPGNGRPGNGRPGNGRSGNGRPGNGIGWRSSDSGWQCTQCEYWRVANSG